jgi:hypothetical protein
MQVRLQMRAYGGVSGQGMHLVEEQLGVLLKTLLLDFEGLVDVVYDPLCAAAHLHKKA